MESAEMQRRAGRAADLLGQAAQLEADQDVEADRMIREAIDHLVAISGTTRVRESALPPVPAGDLLDRLGIDPALV